MNLMRVANGTPARTRADQKRGGQGFDFRLIANQFNYTPFNNMEILRIGDGSNP